MIGIDGISLFFPQIAYIFTQNLNIRYLLQNHKNDLYFAFIIKHSFNFQFFPFPDMDLSSHGHHRSDHPFRPSLGDQQQQPPQLHPQQQQPHYEDSHPPADMLSAASSSLEATSSGYTPSSQSSSPDLDSYLHHRPPKDLHPSQQCYQTDSYKPKIWSLADTATNKALMPYDLCPQTAGWLTGGGMGGSGGGGVPLKSGNPGGNFQSCSAMRFGNYGCFNPISLQTDTPPQTPPNMKVSSSAAHQQAATVPSSAYIETHAAYMGQPALCPQDAMGESQMQGE